MQPLIKLRARRAMVYNTRHLQPGDEFDARARDARLLIAIKKAAEIRTPANIPPPPPALAEKIVATFTPPPVSPAPPDDTVGAMTTSNTGLVPSDDLAPLRAEYEAALGKRPFMGWGRDILSARIAEAKKPE